MLKHAKKIPAKSHRQWVFSIPRRLRPWFSHDRKLLAGRSKCVWKILGGWTFEALDWDTGESVFSYRYGTSPMFNSAYAGTEILSGRCLCSGTLLGMVRMEP